MYLCPESVTEAKAAATALCTLAKRVVDGYVDHGFAVIRPPGHHAEPSGMGGYCLLNNVAIAAAVVMKRKRVRRVAIVDWDVHHGNGTESIFLNDPSVLYFSVHRSNMYPYTGKPEQVGANGRNVNLAWTTPGMGDEEYCCAWQHLLLPMLDEFQPELVLVSAGFDAADGDMGGCCVTPKGFATLTRMLINKGHTLVCALEGGYVQSILGRCVVAVVDTLLQPRSFQIVEPLGLDDVNPSASKAIQRTMKAHQPYWKFLQDN